MNKYFGGINICEDKWICRSKRNEFLMESFYKNEFAPRKTDMLVKWNWIVTEIFPTNNFMEHR